MVLVLQDDKDAHGSSRGQLVAGLLELVSKTEMFSGWLGEQFTQLVDQQLATMTAVADTTETARPTKRAKRGAAAAPVCTTTTQVGLRLSYLLAVRVLTITRAPAQLRKPCPAPPLYQQTCAHEPEPPFNSWMRSLTGHVLAAAPTALSHGPAHIGCSPEHPTSVACTSC